jgi:hypothetical protein
VNSRALNRAYVPLTLAGLRALRDTGELPAGPAYAVTPALRDAYADTQGGDEEDLEYVAMMMAARASMTLLRAADPADRRRIVVAVDAPVAPDDGPPALVRLDAAVPLDRVASVHVDTDDVRPAVDAAVRALPAATDGDAAAVALVDGLDSEDLAWFAVQEIADVLDS